MVSIAENISKPEDSKPVAKNLNDPKARESFRKRLKDLEAYFSQIKDLQDSLRDEIKGISDEYGLDKKNIRKMARTMYKGNYTEQVGEQRQFEELYELLIEGRLRDDETGSELDED